LSFLSILIYALTLSNTAEIKRVLLYLSIPILASATILFIDNTWIVVTGYVTFKNIIFCLLWLQFAVYFTHCCFYGRFGKAWISFTVYLVFDLIFGCAFQNNAINQAPTYRFFVNIQLLILLLYVETYIKAHFVWVVFPYFLAACTFALVVVIVLILVLMSLNPLVIGSYTLIMLYPTWLMVALPFIV
jgi:hypothetical protein